MSVDTARQTGQQSSESLLSLLRPSPAPPLEEQAHVVMPPCFTKELRDLNSGNPTCISLTETSLEASDVFTGSWCPNQAFLLNESIARNR